MEKFNTSTQFREDEISIIHGNVYPKVAGRLRLAHEQNDDLSISTEIIRYDESIAVVKAICTTNKGTFSGIGMASMDRDRKIAPAILELAETRSIARDLRFSGYGLEYCSAEEVSHLNGTNGSPVQTNRPPVQYQGNNHQPDNSYWPATNPQGNNGNPSTEQSQHNNGTHNGANGRITGKQHKYLITLLGNTGKSKTEMDEYCVKTFGATLQHLSKQDASSLISELQQTQ